MPSYIPYKSKDFVIRGNNLVLDRHKAWNLIDKRMRTAVRKAQSYNPVIKEVPGNEENIKRFYPFCPSRNDLPDRLSAHQRMYFAYLGEELVGGIIVSEIANHLFLHFLGVTEEGRKKQISSLLIWHMVEIFSGSAYQFLDIGASFNPNLQKYFSGWGIEKYPLIMRPPEYKPQLLIIPFDNSSLEALENPDCDVVQYFNQRFGKEYTFFPRGMYAIYALFKWFKESHRMKDGQEVCIRTTTESPYISSCVTSAIEQSFPWGREINEKTGAIFVIHEFGFLHPAIGELKEKAEKNGIPLIEDCAYAFQSGQAGEYGDYLIYSFPKIFPMQFGGLLAGKDFDYQYVWDNFGCADKNKEDICKKRLSCYLPRLPDINERRRENYQFYQQTFGLENTFFPLEKDIVPGVFVLKVEDEKRMKEISAFVRQFGIECGNYYYNNAIFFPVHQNLGKAHLEYIAGAVRAMYREGCGL